MRFRIWKRHNDNAHDNSRYPEQNHIKEQCSQPIGSSPHAHYKRHVLKLDLSFGDDAATERRCVETVSDGHEID
jgi:hypothetical protein